MMAHLSGDRRDFLAQVDEGRLGAIYEGSLYAEVAADLLSDGLIVATRRGRDEWGEWTMYERAEDRREGSS